MPGQVRMTERAARQYVAKMPTTPAQPPKPPKRAVKQTAIKRGDGLSENGQGDLPPQIGARYRVARGMKGTGGIMDNPPPMKTVCVVVEIAGRLVYLDGTTAGGVGEYRFAVTVGQLTEYFEAIEEG
jgi:hypothetical protein